MSLERWISSRYLNTKFKIKIIKYVTKYSLGLNVVCLKAKIKSYIQRNNAIYVEFYISHPLKFELIIMKARFAILDFSGSLARIDEGQYR